MLQVFEIPDRLPGLNEYTKACRERAIYGGAMKAKATEACAKAIRDAGLSAYKGKIDIQIRWVEPNMKRDKDNIRFAAKFILDALVKEQIIENDGWKWIGRISDVYMVNKNNPRIVVTIEDSAEKGVNYERVSNR